MSDKIKDIIVSVLFVAIIVSTFIINIAIKDSDVSTSERRKLAQFSKINLDSISSGELSDTVEEYAMDQFFLRDEFRSIKSFIKLDILRQKDNNELFIIDNNIYKMEYPLDENSVMNIINKINNIYEKYLSDEAKVFYTIIPDKNYYLDSNLLYLKLDYRRLENIMKENINSNIKYINIFDELSSNDYYRTDTHWKQENITKVAEKIANEMGFLNRITLDFEKKEYSGFYGAYYGQLGKKVEPDNIYYLTNSIIDNAKTFNYETNKEGSVYDISKADSSMDKYDLFLSGATPIIQIRNENSTIDKELIIFRDSFGSSIAPLFTEAYSKITLIDIRYISTDLLSKYVEFNNTQDVLFLYSTLVINESGALK